MLNLEVFKIDYVKTNGKLTWLKSRGSEFYILDGVWYCHTTQSFRKSLDITEDGRSFTFVCIDGDTVTWDDDGYTYISSPDGSHCWCVSPEGERTLYSYPILKEGHC